MSEEIVEAPTLQEPPTKPLEEVLEPVATPSQSDPEPKKRGRPQGAKDIVKRTRKSVVKIRVEPLVREPPVTVTEPTTAQPSSHPQAPMPAPITFEAPEPESPRTLFRRHHEAMSREMRQKKQEWAQRYTSNWVALPI